MWRHNGCTPTLVGSGRPQPAELPFSVKRLLQRVQEGRESRRIEHTPTVCHGELMAPLNRALRRHLYMSVKMLLSVYTVGLPVVCLSKLLTCVLWIDQRRVDVLWWHDQKSAYQRKMCVTWFCVCVTSHFYLDNVTYMYCSFYRSTPVK